MTSSFLLWFLVADAEQPSWDLIRQAIQTQESLAYYAITAIFVLVVIILGGTWLSNFILHRRAITRAIEDIGNKTRKMLKKDYDIYVRRIEGKVQKIEKEVGKSIGKEIAQLREDIDREIIILSAEKARIFAIVMKDTRGNMVKASTWWASAITKYAEAQVDEGIRISVDALIKTLAKCTSMKKDELNIIRKCTSFIPTILKKEKRIIEGRIEKLQKPKTN